VNNYDILKFPVTLDVLGYNVVCMDQIVYFKVTLETVPIKGFYQTTIIVLTIMHTDASDCTYQESRRASATNMLNVKVMCLVSDIKNK